MTAQGRQKQTTHTRIIACKLVSKFIAATVFSGTAILGVGAFAYGEDEGDRYALSANYLFVPSGFDDNDKVQVVIDGWVDNSCDQVLNPKVVVHPDQKTIVVEAQAVRPSEGYCMPVLTRFTSVVDVGVLPHGNWEVVTNNGWLVESLTIEEASSSGPDSYQFANVDEVFVDYAPDRMHERNADSKWSAVIKGAFRTSCESLDFIEVVDSGSTIEVLPVVKTEGEICMPREVPFEQRVFLPDIQEKGRYLLHVRTANGGALNQVFSAFEE